MEEQKYSEILKKYSFEQLVYERAILEKEKANLYIKDKELTNEFKRRLEDK
jgi:hypothetical protein